MGLENAHEYLKSQMGSARTTPRLMPAYPPVTAVTVPEWTLPVLECSGRVPMGTMWKVEGLIQMRLIWSGMLAKKEEKDSR